MAGSTIRRTSVSASTAASNGISGLTDISSILKVKKAEKEAEEAEKLNGGLSNGGHHQGPRRTSVAFSDLPGGQKPRQTPMSEQRGPQRTSQARNSQARASMKGPRDSMSNG